MNVRHLAVLRSIIVRSTVPGNFGDENLGFGRKGVLAHAEGVGIEKPCPEGSVKEALEHIRVVVIVHGDRDFRFDLVEYHLGVFRRHRIGAADGKQQHIDMSDELELVFIKRFSQVTGMADAETVQFKDKGRALDKLIAGSHVDGNL